MNFWLRIFILLHILTIFVSSRKYKKFTKKLREVRELERFFGSRELEETLTVLVETRNHEKCTAIKGEVTMEIDSTGVHVCAITVAKEDASELLKELENDPNVLLYEPDGKVFAIDQSSLRRRSLAETVPYGINEVLQGKNFTDEFGYPTGSSKVCVIDTGYNLGHEDLPLENSGVTGRVTAYNPWKTDAHGHGTHVAGTIAAIGQNNLGVAGVIPGSLIGNGFSLVISRGLSDGGSGSHSAIIKAIDECVVAGAKIVNLSIQGSTFSQIYQDTFDNYYYNHDVLFVAASGNSAWSVKYPAFFPSVMSVAATNSAQDVTSFSTRNSGVEISAPGLYIKSAKSGGGYVLFSGTSMAAPHVAGVAGLLSMYFPQCKNFEIRAALTKTVYKKSIMSDTCDMNYGQGVVRAYDAYKLLESGYCNPSFTTVPVARGGCDQLCVNDCDCNDYNNTSLDICDNGVCRHKPHSRKRIALGQAWQPHRAMMNHPFLSQTHWDSEQNSMTFAGWFHYKKFWAYKSYKPGTIRIAVGQAWQPHRIMMNHPHYTQDHWNDESNSMSVHGWHHYMHFYAYPTKQPGTIRIAVGQAWWPHRAMVNHPEFGQNHWNKEHNTMSVKGWSHYLEFWAYENDEF